MPERQILPTIRIFDRMMNLVQRFAAHRVGNMGRSGIARDARRTFAKIGAIGFASLLMATGAGRAEPSGTSPMKHLQVIYLSKRYDEPPPLSLLDKPLKDKGIEGARVGAADNNATGKFVGQETDLTEDILPEDGDIVAEAKKIFAAGNQLVVADLEAKDLLAVADLPEAKNAIILDIRTSDDDLRQEQCRANIFHLAPSYAMRADALGQFLVYKRWQRWFLIHGAQAADLDYAAAVRRAAARFGSRIVAERTYTYNARARTTDTGHQQTEQQMALLTQGAPDYDVIFVIDMDEVFGEYLLFNSFDPRPVVGTQGLVAVAWHRSFEEYAGQEMQNRFERCANRVMTERDYEAWLAVRIFGEAMLRTGATDAKTLRDYILSDDFNIAAYKGIGLSFRKWDLQLRQPILLAGPRALISIAPIEGFLHPKFLTDSLGYDAPETKCHFHD
jgi:ABC transporter substrate binding protein (PQQ-dependent alcohol dehydrogenase system)